MDFDDPDDISLDREANEASRIIDAADDGTGSSASRLLMRPSMPMIESLCDRIADTQDIYRLKTALRYCVHFSTLYDYDTIIRILGLPARCEETVAFSTEDDKREAGGGS
jgi:hypothetical protein